MILRALTVLGALLFFVPQARAVTCTVQGTLKYAPTDYYYCDTDFFPDCSGARGVRLTSPNSP